ncbi:hypothetical protein HMPREF2738_00804 [Clostridiales bacterium KLE1615]|nr:hypothetical protein HMPREF2738_00804 [Clostridiales bacterium KLE1615]
MLVPLLNKKIKRKDSNVIMQNNNIINFLEAKLNSWGSKIFPQLFFAIIKITSLIYIL